MVTAIDHIHYHLRDVDASAKFFETLGLKTIHRTLHTGKAVELKIPGFEAIVELCILGRTLPLGVNHIAHQVPDINKAYQILKTQGINFEPFPSEIIPFFIPDTGRWCLNTRDPVGWRVQLVDAKREEPIGSDEEDEVKVRAPKEFNPLVTAIDHIQFLATDIEATAKFYQTLGYKRLEKTVPAAGEAELKLPGFETILKIAKVFGPNQPGLNHVAFRVPDIKKAYEILGKQGFEFIPFPKPEIPCFDPEEGKWVLNMRDPNGICVQLVSDK